MEQQYILGKYTRVVVHKKNAIFGAGSKQFIINDRKHWENLVLLAAQWIEKSEENLQFAIVNHVKRKL